MVIIIEQVKHITCTWDTLAGDCLQASLLSFPADTTIGMPDATSLLTALSIVKDRPPPIDMVTMAGGLAFRAT